MKTTLTFVLALLISAISFAQNGINYKAVIKDNTGNVVANQTIDVQFTILEVATNVYQETHAPTTDANGIIILNIGEGTPVSGTFAVIDWSSSNHFLNVQIDLGSGYVDLGTTAFKAVPYALHAETADNVPTKINDLDDAKSDNDGTENGSSLFLGLDAGANDDSTDNQNVGVGNQALYSNISGSYNTAYGIATLYSNTSGSNNIAIGDKALIFNDLGSNNALGGAALYSNTSGSENTAVGNGALFQNILGSGNVALGHEAGLFETGSNKLYISNSDTNTPLIFGDFATPKLTVNGDLKVTGRIGLNTDVVIGSEDFTIKSLTDYYGGMYIDSPDITEGKPFYGYAINGDAKAWSYYDAEDNTWKMSINNTDRLILTTAGRLGVAEGLQVGGTVGEIPTFTSHKLTVLADEDNKAFRLIGNTGAVGYGARFNFGDADYVYIEESADDELTIHANRIIMEASSQLSPDIILGGNSSTGAGDDGIISSDHNYSSSDIFLRSNDAVVVQLDYDNDEDGEFQILSGTSFEVFKVDESGNVSVNGSVKHASDRRLKKDITDLPYGLKEVLQLQPKAYNWKNRTQDHKSLGLIAQDVQPIIKEIVSAKDDAQKTLGISYTELIPILINAIKEQQDIIKRQDSKLDQQNQKINGLTAELETNSETQKVFNLRLEKMENLIELND